LVHTLKTLFSMEKCKGVLTPGTVSSKVEDTQSLSSEEHHLYRRGVGILLWLSHDRIDIQYSVKQLCAKASSPNQWDLIRLKRLIRYLSCHEGFTLVFEPNNQTNCLIGHSDSDWAGDKESRRSTSGGILYFRGMILTSYSKSQHVIALSSAEAELYALCSLVVESLAVQNLMCEAGFGKLRIQVFTDAQATKQNLERGTARGLRHVEIKFMFIRDLLREDKLQLSKIVGSENTADLLTKPVTKDVLRKLIKTMPVELDFDHRLVE